MSDCKEVIKKMTTKAHYTNISIPTELAHGIDEYIKDNSKLGFQSRAQVVIHALRQILVIERKK